ncbi:MAG: hypothetical protein K6U12_12045, partial [Armatimonadetes bacterium]|nr:hypothetical protein [Armatimonadota bacterium]
MFDPTPQEMLELQEQMAQVYRSEERWEALYETIHFILSILRWFPDIVDDTEEKVKKYKEEI